MLPSTNIRQKAFFAIGVLTLAIDFLYLVVQHTVSSQLLPADPVHTAAVIIGYGALALYLVQRRASRSYTPLQDMGRSVIAVTAILLLLGLANWSHVSYMDVQGSAAGMSASDMVVAALLSISTLIASLLIFTSLSGMVFVRPRSNTRRNYVVMLLLFLVYIVLEYLSSAAGLGLRSLSLLRHLAFAALILSMIVNCFRFSWILDMNKREKLILLLLSFFGFAFFLILLLFTSQDTPLADALLLYHPLLYAFVNGISLFGTLYLGVGFASTLLHLPTAKEFDRKKLEISSLQNMSRLITQVFDFDELVATTTHLAIEVSEGSAAWLELDGEHVQLPPGGHRRVVHHSMRNISAEELDQLRMSDGRYLQDLAVETAKPMLIADLGSDRRLARSGSKRRAFASLAVIPLNSHGGIIGVLCVAKKEAHGFDEESANVLYAFADMVAVALENSHLIRESIVKERLEQEILVAQKMQRSLLPQHLPSSSRFEIAARSVPAYEVGGDYYDVVQLDEHRLGFIIGDVSGKGVSAALYMAQVKGVFQSLQGSGASTRDILVHMNAPLCHGMEKKSFISMLYAVLDTRDGRLHFSRAGHCPLLHYTSGVATYRQPGGMALGLESSDRFADVLEEERLQLHEGDVIVMYTDGVTEARNPAGSEFQTERLSDLIVRRGEDSAARILEHIIDAVQGHREGGEAEDDVTLMVLQWKRPDLINDENEIH